jgi:ubiquinone/menaquinone biosynthesis C-methylase UbiE
MDLIDEQVEYYRRRAGEYDEWWFREGRWALPEPARHRWLADVAEVEAALERFAPGGEVLELACGTGLWTRHLVRHAGRLTAVDAAPEMIARNRDRVPGEVSYVRADIFDWTPPAHGFDVCFFSYWRVFLIDSYHAEPRVERTQPRVLNDGSRYTVVKRFWQPDELVAHTARLGFALDVRVTRHGAILYATGWAS